MATKNTKKTDSEKKRTSSKSRTQKSSKASAPQSSEKRSEQALSRFSGDPDSIGNQIARFVLFAVGVLLFIFLFFTDMKSGLKARTGPVGYGICCFCFGLLGKSAYLLPFLCLLLAIFWKRSLKGGTLLLKIVSSLLTAPMVGALLQLPVQSSDSPVPFYRFWTLWKEGINGRGGGILGGLPGGLFYLLLKGVSWVILIFLLLIDLMLLSEITPAAMARFFKRMGKSIGAWMAQRKVESEQIEADKPVKKGKASADAPSDKTKPKPEAESDSPSQTLPTRKRKIFGLDEEEEKPQLPEIEVQPVNMEPVSVNSPVNDPLPNEPIAPVYVAPNRETKGGGLFGTPRYGGAAPAPIPDSPARKGAQTAAELDLNDIYRSPEKDEAADRLGQAFTDGSALYREGGEGVDMDIQDDHAPWEAPDGDGLSPEEEAIADLLLDTTRKPLADDTLPSPAEKLYRFPPITLLSQNTDNTSVDFSDELQKKGEKLVSTLKSFRVDTEIVNISHGPTITRYELVPKVGVRVRAIANLVDDIALNLETTGVRVEAPIPGKSAVGIEVPNKHPQTVYLRQLLENPAFAQAKSKVTAALGMDVAGQPVFVDIAKMPHLLIAGATGMGKSVCINSLLISLLYKATPDELKLILIDPKKVELNVYNKLPHLLVPVVNAPKKAAGSLSWAVGEMERRFELIEEVGVRDIKGYNQVTANDPAKEFLPHIVIIIDELADLMMTAPDDVEESICRIAQKARAAGMHLIIGTQRPSVNVITGLIKANIPTRIAFTVTSQIDSRTIIDMAGAEKLIGRGDMLYSPVGALKPIRVQGSFVSDKEVEAVCDFIRAQVGDGEYDTSVIEQIEKNAEQCGQKKRGGAADLADEETGEIDPKFEDAVSVALEEGKISTSLLQRRLSLGYGRAAKIIDRMEQCGIVGKQEGSKPRTLLITASDWNEIKMRKEE